MQREKNHNVNVIVSRFFLKTLKYFHPSFVGTNGTKNIRIIDF